MKALITGVSGQDGAYLAQLLLNKGYEVIGTSRDVDKTEFSALQRLAIVSDVELLSCDLTDFTQFSRLVSRYSPTEIYNLAAQSSVGLSFEYPIETFRSIAVSTLNQLETIRLVDKSICFYNAGSSECFGDTGQCPATELTPFRPKSPYAVAKSTSHMLVKNYRETHGIYACSGILFNHESPLRPDKYVTQKIVRAAAEIAAGLRGRLELGDLSVQRDWGWAPEYVDAMWKIMHANHPDDYVIATGRTVSLEYFIECVFQFFGLDWRNFTEVNETFLRPADIPISRADPSKANQALGWKALVPVEEVINRLCVDAQTRVESLLISN
jgi:GDPmannose 4,6-dehydratase